MSSEAPSPSTSTAGFAASSKRQRVDPAATKPGTTSSPPSTVVKSPSEASKDAWLHGYVETLHRNLQPFFEDLLSGVHRAFATHEWKRLKHKDMEHDVNYVPNSCKIGLTLNTVEEVKQGEDFKALNVQLDSAIFECQQKLAGFAVKASALTRDAYHERFKSLFCKALAAAARGFIAEHDIQEYSAHQAVIDCIATYPDEMISPLNTSVTAFLKAYKAANEIPSLPEPTMTSMLDENGNPTFLVAEIQAVNNSTAAPPAEAEAPPPPHPSSVNHSRSRVAPPPSGNAPAPVPIHGNNAGGQGAAEARNHTSSVGFRSAQSLLRNSSHDPATGTPILYLDGRSASAVTATRGSDHSASTHRRLLSGLENEPFTFTANPYNTNNVTPGVWGHGQRGVTHPGQDDRTQPSSGTRANCTNHAISALNSGDDDFVMSENEMEENTIMAGGKSLILDLLVKFAEDGIYGPVQVFINQIKSNNDAKRIKKAMKPSQLATAADRIAAVVGAGRPVAPPTLTGLINNQVDDATAKLAREVQSLKAQLATSQKKHPKGQGSNNNSKKGRQPAAAKTTNRNQSQARKPNENRQAGGRNNDTSNGSGGSNNNKGRRHSNNKSSGKGRGSSNKRRS